MIFFSLFIVALALFVYLFMQQPQFGKAPAGARLQRLQQSPHYRNGQFQNESPTPALTEGASYWGILQKFLWARNRNGSPPAPLPSQKVNLRQLPPDADVLVWFGHSSYFIQLQGKKILVDPVMSGSASPVRFTTRAFAGSDAYTVNDLPDIDYLFLSHDHWDHLDYKTLLELKGKVKKIITGLGVGAHLEHWGFAPQMIKEKDWYETEVLDDGFTVHTAPARHFSGRGFKRNGTLWLSFVLQAPNYKIYMGGDSGYDDHFKKLGETYGPFDLAILENGQYDANWKYIHMMPDEVVQAAKDLQARRLLAVHWGKFTLAHHDWNEPIEKTWRLSRQQQLPLLTPMIGQPLNLKDASAAFEPWWQKLP